MLACLCDDKHTQMLIKIFFCVAEVANLRQSNLFGAILIFFEYALSNKIWIKFKVFGEFFE